MIRERVKASLDRARAKGRKLGRPSISPEKEKAIQEHLTAGRGINATAEALKVGNGTVERVRRGMQA